jgi:hypothetical protein
VLNARKNKKPQTAQHLLAGARSLPEAAETEQGRYYREKESIMHRKASLGA